MTRLTSDSFAGIYQFPYATVTTDLFKKEDVQTLALAVNQHDHTVGLGHQIPTGGLVDGAVTGAKINLGQVNLGGDLTGTLAAGRVRLANGSSIDAYNSTGQVHPLMSLGGDNVVNIFNAGNGNIRFLGQSGAAPELGHFSGDGSFSAAGHIVAGLNLMVTSGLIQLTALHTSVQGDGTNVILVTDIGAAVTRAANGLYVQTFTAGWAPIQSGAITLQEGSLVIGQAGAVMQLGIGGPYWQNSSGTMACNTPLIYPSATTNSIVIAGGGTIDSGPTNYVRISQLTVSPGDLAAASMHCNGPMTIQGAATVGGALTAGGAITSTQGTYQFLNTTVSILFDGTYLRHSHSIIFNTTGNQIVWPNGSFISGNAGYVQGSQASLKEGVAPVPDAESSIRVADPRMVVSSYNWPGDSRQSLGFMAENVAEVLPNYVIRDEGGNPTGYVPQELTAILWGAVRDLISRVTALETPA